MKISKLLALLLIVTLFASCKDDDKDPAELILGTWNIEAFDGMVDFATTSPSYNTSGVFASVASDLMATITFNVDGTYTNAGSYTSTDTYTVDGETETEVYNETGGLFVDGTYTLINDQVNLIDEDGDMITFDIDKISSKTLNMTAMMTETNVDEDETTTLVTVINIDLSK